MKRISLIAGLSVCLGLCGSASATPFTITDMGFRLQLGGSPLINDSRQVAGNRVVDGQGQGLIWDNGVITNLGVLPWALQSAPFGINNATQIVGGMDGAWIWENGSISPLTALPGGAANRTIALDINNNGLAVGINDIGGSEELVIWQGGSVSSLGLTGADVSAINDVGQVVGHFNTGSSFLFNNGAVVGLSFRPLDINNGGQIVGTLYPGGQLNPQAISWKNGAETLLPFLPNTTQSDARAVNDAGLVVGVSKMLGLSIAALWVNDIGYDLNTLINEAGWELLDATDINAGGDIVGVGINPSGERSAFLLTRTSDPLPTGDIPEPTTLALITIGMAGIGYSRKRIAA